MPSMRGRRKDFIEFHPAWHKWMGLNRQFDTHAHPFNHPHSSSKWVEWAARFIWQGRWSVEICAQTR